MAISPQNYLAQYNQQAGTYLKPYQQAAQRASDAYLSKASGIMAYENYTKNYGAYSSAMTGLNQAQQSLPDATSAQAWANQQAAYGLADENISNLANNPTDQMVRQSLQGVMTGKTTPYNDEVRNSLMTGAAQQSAAGVSQQSQQIQDQAAQRGVSPNDPSVQAAMRQAQATGQQNTQDSRLNVAQKANVANFNAQQQATNQMGSYNTQQEQMASEANLNKQNMLWNQRVNSNNKMPGFQQFMAAKGGPSNAGI